MQIDEMVYELYGLTAEKVRAVEGKREIKTPPDRHHYTLIGHKRRRPYKPEPRSEARAFAGGNGSDAQETGYACFLCAPSGFPHSFPCFSRPRRAECRPRDPARLFCSASGRRRTENSSAPRAAA